MMKTNMITQVKNLAKRGHFHSKEANADRNKDAFSKAPTGVNANCARLLVAQSPETTEKTIVNWSTKTNGLTKGQATALCISAHRFALKITGKKTLSSAALATFEEALGPMIDDFLATDDDDLIEEDDLEDDDDLTGELSEDEISEDEPTPTATVEADFIPYDDLKTALATVESRTAVVQGAMAVFFGDDNTDKDGHLQYRVDGKARTKSISQLEVPAKSKKTQTQLFMDKIASMAGMNMAGIATKRGGNWASDYVFKAGSKTATPNRNLNRIVRDRLGVLWCAIVVKSGSTDCTLDMRKFVSDDTIERVRAAFICPQADLSDATYTKNNEQVPYATGWLHNYSRGNSNGSVSYNDIVEDITTFL